MVWEYCGIWNTIYFCSTIVSNIYQSVYTSNSNPGNVLDRFIYELQ